jgi:hypothetical protein
VLTELAFRAFAAPLRYGMLKLIALLPSIVLLHGKIAVKFDDPPWNKLKDSMFVGPVGLFSSINIGLTQLAEKLSA